MRRGRLQPGPVLAAGRPRVLSIQTVTITIAVNQTSGTTALARSVVPEHARVIYLGDTGDDDGTNSWQQLFARVALQGNQTVIAYRQVADDVYTTTVQAMVIHYSPGVARVQRGVVVSGTPVTIQRVNTSRAELELLGYTYTGASSIVGLATTRPRLALTSTQVSNAGGSSAGFQVTEWLA